MTPLDVSWLRDFGCGNVPRFLSGRVLTSPTTFSAMLAVREFER